MANVTCSKIAYVANTVCGGNVALNSRSNFTRSSTALSDVTDGSCDKDGRSMEAFASSTNLHCIVRGKKAVAVAHTLCALKEGLPKVDTTTDPRTTFYVTRIKLCELATIFRKGKANDMSAAQYNELMEGPTPKILHWSTGLEILTNFQKTWVISPHRSSDTSFGRVHRYCVLL